MSATTARLSGRALRDEIPITAQVVALADVYDALTSKRCYKRAYSQEEAIRMILNGECGRFNPLLLDCLLAVKDQLYVKLHTTPTADASRTGADSYPTAFFTMKSFPIRLLQYQLACERISVFYRKTDE